MLRRLGFEIDESKGKGSHAKAIHLTRRAKRPGGTHTNFVVIPDRKDYSKPLREDFIKEIEAFGFSREEILDEL